MAKNSEAIELNDAALEQANGGVQIDHSHLTF